MLTVEDMAAMMEAEEKRLGVNSPEFMERHNEIMSLIEQSRNKKNAPASVADTDRGE